MCRCRCGCRGSRVPPAWAPGWHAREKPSASSTTISFSGAPADRCRSRRQRRRTLRQEVSDHLGYPSRRCGRVGAEYGRRPPWRRSSWRRSQCRGSSHCRRSTRRKPPWWRLRLGQPEHQTWSARITDGDVVAVANRHHVCPRALDEDAILALVDGKPAGSIDTEKHVGARNQCQAGSVEVDV